MKTILPTGSVKTTRWNTARQSLPQIEETARITVRKMKPDLVLLAVPRSASFASDEEFIKAHIWIQNWSLSFGREAWSCVIVHPSVTEGHDNRPPETTIRNLVSAHDLHLIDRMPADQRPATEIVRDWFEGHLNSAALSNGR
jgi:hypothetical protein